LTLFHLGLRPAVTLGRNQPLRREKPKWKSDYPMTGGQLRCKRDEFWDTAPAFEGRKEIWDALKAAAHAFESEEHELAQAILDGASITLPHGVLSECYDELGNRYQLPVYCLSEPVNIMEEQASDGPVPPKPQDHSETLSETGQEVQLHLRLSTGRDVHLDVRSNDSVSHMKHRLQAEEGLATAAQRWFFSGRMLADKSTLEELCIPTDYVVQMILLVLQVLFVLPYTTRGSIKVAESFWTLKANELVVDEDMAKYGSKVQVPLMCGEAFEGQDIMWRREDGEKLQEQGNRILVTVEERRGGRYTCYNRDDSYLNHTLVLVRWPYKKIIKEMPEKGYIHCSTNNYNGSFYCSWKWDEKRAGKVVLIKAVRSHSGGNISCSLNSSGHSITCQDQEYCPYAEELEHINLTIYFRSNYVVEIYCLQFQISDIVRPDMVRVKRMNNTLELQYPDTWNIPFSYFPLTFQVKEIRCGRKSDCDCSNRKSSKVNLVQDQHWPLKKGVTVCVRAQDDLCNSPWSEWTQYKCIKEKNKKKARKNKKRRPWKEE
ncbi:hypothetical protein NFI96_031173, partial [Prochilodus magdalenae]